MVYLQMIYDDLHWFTVPIIKEKCGVSTATLNNQWLCDVSIHVSRIKYQRIQLNHPFIDLVRWFSYELKLVISIAMLDHLSRKVYMIYYVWHQHITDMSCFFWPRTMKSCSTPGWSWMDLSQAQRYAHTNPTTRALCKMCSISASNFDLLDLFWFQICLVFDIFGCL